jgi:hypothetical protein
MNLKQANILAWNKWTSKDSEGHAWNPKKKGMCCVGIQIPTPARAVVYQLAKLGEGPTWEEAFADAERRGTGRSIERTIKMCHWQNAHAHLRRFIRALKRASTRDEINKYSELVKKYVIECRELRRQYKELEEAMEVS